jgi:hypothetical protein
MVSLQHLKEKAQHKEKKMRGIPACDAQRSSDHQQSTERFYDKTTTKK